ncbi:hypothetical protein ABIF31_000062 [Bradyrhizobium elkanii]
MSAQLIYDLVPLGAIIRFPTARRDHRTGTARSLRPGNTATAVVG